MGDTWKMKSLWINYHCLVSYIWICVICTGCLLPMVVQGQNVPECTEFAVTTCIQPLSKYNLDEPFFPQLNRAQLTAMCNDYNTAEICLLPLKPTCDLFQRRHYEGLESAYDYICGAGFEIYLGNYDCYGLKPLRARVNACNDTFQMGKYDVQRDAYKKTYADMQAETCRRMNTYMYCIRDTIADRCGDEAGDWQLEVNVRSIERVLNEMNCHIGRPLLSGAEIAGIVVGCVVVVIIILVIIYLFTCNVQRYKKRKARYDCKTAVSPQTVVSVPETKTPIDDDPDDDPVNDSQMERNLKLNLSFTDDANSNVHIPKKSSLKSPASVRRAMPELPPTQTADVTARSSEIPMSTRLKLNLSWAEDLHSTYETLPDNPTQS